MQKRRTEKQGSPEKALKSPKLDENNVKTGDTLDEKYTVVEVKKLLKNQETLLTGLTKLREALRRGEGKGFKVFVEFVKDNSECPDLYRPLDKGRQNQTPLELQIALEVLEKLLLFCADSEPHAAVGIYHVRRLLQNHLKLLYSCLNPASHPNMIKATLRLLVAMVTQGPLAAREVVAVFDFTLKAFASLVNKKEIKNHDSIRSCYVKFSLSFLMYGDDATIRHILDVKGFLSIIFKMLSSDPPYVVVMVLKALHEKVVKNLQVPKKTKVMFFNSYVLAQVISLYSYKTNNNDDDDRDDDDHNIRNLTCGLLEDLCCTFKFGICFANQSGMFAARSNNPVLLRFLQSLPKNNQEPNTHELIIKILTCCPDMVTPYLENLKHTYEPRLSVVWLANVNFVMKLYSALPLPSVMIQRCNVKLAEAQIQSVVNIVLPVGLTRTNLNHGILHSSLLVKNTTLGLILLVLRRAADLLDFCHRDDFLKHVESFVESLRDALAKVLPDVKTVISLRQNLLVSVNSKTIGQQEALESQELDHVSSEEKRPTLLLARVVQVLHSYQRVQPHIFSTTAFDLGKLLPGRDGLGGVGFPAIVQYYTLRILLNVSPGSFKWYQQKSKNGPSSMYSILKMLVKSNTPEVKSVSGSLVHKFLRDEGIVSEHSCEIQIWLKHLKRKTFADDQEALLLFLDSVCYSVAMEPYTYTDVVMEMSSQARQSGGQQLPCLESSLEDRVPFSPLVIKALMTHVRMVSSLSQHDYTVDQLASIARYINVVVLDLLSLLRDPLPLLLTVYRFYGNIRWTKQSTYLRSIHESLVQYVCLWSGETPQVSNVSQTDDRSPKKVLRTFYKEPGPSKRQLVKVLCHLDKEHLCKEIVKLVQHCLSEYRGDVSFLADLLTATPYCLLGSGPFDEALFPLLKQLPFANLAWQVFGPLVLEARGLRGGKEPKEPICLDAIHHPGLQSLLVESLQREKLFPALCNHLLCYLSVFVSVTRDTKCVEEKHRLRDRESVTAFTSGFALVFQLLELMIDKLNKPSNEVSQNCDKTSDKTIEIKEDCISTDSCCVTKNKHGMRDFCETLLVHPVFYNCFVQESKDGFSSSLASCVSNILRLVADKVDKEMVKPYMIVICNNALTEISNAMQEHDVSSDGQALKLLQAFRAYCEHQYLVKTVTALLDLPLDRLVHHQSIFYQALISLVNTLQNPTNLDSLSTSSNHRLSFVGLAEVSVSCCKRLVELTMTAPSTDLEEIVLKLIRTSPKLLLTLEPTVLDFCLDYFRSGQISLTKALISCNPCLRRQFERRVAGDKFVTLLSTDALLQFVPIAQCYLAMYNTGVSLDNEAVRLLTDKYWPFLWNWLLAPKTTEECSPESPMVSVLKQLICLKANDNAQDLIDRLIGLLNITSDQAWDSCQISVLDTLVKNLPNTQDSGTLLWNTLSACMANISLTLSRNAGSCSTVEVALQVLNDLTTKRSDLLSKIDCEDPCFEADNWAAMVKSCLKYNFDSITALKCMTVCIKPLYTMTHRKAVAQALPLTKIYEMILTHSRFLEVILDESSDEHVHKEIVLSLMVATAEMSPECCQESHIPVLFAAYSASLSKPDQLLLYLLRLYERAHVALTSCRPYLWGKAALHHYKVRKMQGPSLWQQPSSSDVLELLDESMLNGTALEFPLDRKLVPGLIQNKESSPHYDPSFLIPLFFHLLAPNSEVNCRKFVERGGLGYTVAALSSRDEHMRKAGTHVLSRFLTQLEASSFREKKQVHLLLVSFKNGIYDVNARVSSVITRFISRAAYVMLHPDHQMYFLLNSFFLQRAVMDLREVPLFYTLFNSSSLKHRYERNWILELLCEGLRDAQDYYVYKKRHVMELAMSFHDSQMSDQQSRKLVVGLVGAALGIHSAAFDLARNYGIVAWIHSLGLGSEVDVVSSSLRLLHTLWFTIQHGKPDLCGKEPHPKPIPPDLAAETLLVCKTYIKYFRSV